MTISKEQYQAALDIVSQYKAQELVRKQTLLSVISNEITAYLNEHGPKIMLDFEVFIDLHSGAIELHSKSIENADFDGSEAFHKALDNIGKKHDIVIQLPYCYFMK